ncbi:hypothetical protein ACTJJE_24855 [Mycolicibacterium sp. 22603]|uniref:hypothetical protein n=1 Tax=Mycolicibacterium sp. 22603 TaxID=3453950 RepID=UPI003F87B8B9
MSSIVLYRLRQGLTDRRPGHSHPMSDHSHEPDTNAEHDAEEVAPPGPTDKGRSGGMATREVAPDVVEKHRGESLT